MFQSDIKLFVLMLQVIGSCHSHTLTYCCLIQVVILDNFSFVGFLARLRSSSLLLLNIPHSPTTCVVKCNIYNFCSQPSHFLHFLLCLISDNQKEVEKIVELACAHNVVLIPFGGE